MLKHFINHFYKHSLHAQTALLAMRRFVKTTISTMQQKKEKVLYTFDFLMCLLRRHQSCFNDFL